MTGLALPIRACAAFLAVAASLIPAFAPASAQVRAIQPPPPTIVVPPPVATPRPAPPRVAPPPVVAPRPVPPRIVAPQIAPPRVVVPRPTPPRVVVPRITPQPTVRSRLGTPAAPARAAPPADAGRGPVAAPRPRAVGVAAPPSPPLPPARFGSLAAPESLAGGGYDPDEIEARTVVAALAPGLGVADGVQVAADNALAVLESADIALIGSVVLRLRIEDGRGLDAVLADLAGDARVAYAGPNRIYRPQAGAGAQYALDTLGLAGPGAAPVATGRGVSIAVIDTAPDLAHPELAQAGVRLESVLDDAPALDHGTQIVGLLAAAGLLRGAAPDADVLAIAAFGPGAEDGLPASATYRLLRALDVAHREGAAVVNMSFAGGADDLLAQGLDALAQGGAILVAAAGNNGPDAPPAFPGAHPAVVAATATDVADGLWARANRGAYVALSAPGVDVLSPAAGGRYALGSGTSLAAAYVSAVAALVLERNPRAGPDAVRAALAGSARDLGPAGRDPLFGHGLAVAGAAAERLAASR